MGRATKGARKKSKKLSRTHLDQISEFIKAYIASEMRGDVIH